MTRKSPDPDWSVLFAADHLAGEVRRALRERRLPLDAACVECGKRDIDQLVPGSDPLLCRDCTPGAKRAPLDVHHVAGQANSRFALRATKGAHAVLSAMQHDWPVTTLENTQGSPALAIAGALRGAADVLRFLADYLLGWPARFLEGLDPWLCERIGPDWWEQFRAWFSEQHGGGLSVT